VSLGALEPKALEPKALEPEALEPGGLEPEGLGPGGPKGPKRLVTAGDSLVTALLDSCHPVDKWCKYTNQLRKITVDTTKGDGVTAKLLKCHILFT
jgi:hypothetical protein